MIEEKIPLFTQTRKQDLSTRVVNHLSCLTLKVLTNNKLGRVTYGVLLCIENAIIAFLLIIQSYPNFEYHDLLDTRNIQILPKIESELERNIFLAVAITVYVILILLGVLFFKLLLTSKNFDHVKEISIVIRIFAVWIINEASVYFTLIILAILSFSSFTVLTIYSFSIATIPIQTPHLPWAALRKQTLYFKEAFKILIIVQEVFIFKGGLRNVHWAHIVYFLFLTFSLAFFTYKRAIYLDPLVDKINKYSLRLTFSVALICIFRLAFVAQLLEIAIFYPIIAFSVSKLLDSLEQRNQTKLFKKLELKESMNAEQFQLVIHELMIILERQNQDDIKWLQRLQYYHRLNCFKDECICNNYQRIILDFYRNQEPQILKQNVQQQSRPEDAIYPEDSSIDNSTLQIEKISKPSNLKFNLLPVGSINNEEQKEEPMRQTYSFLENNTSSQRLDLNFFIPNAAFTQNCIINDFNLEELFKDTFSQENFVKKGFDYAQNHQNFQQNNQDLLSKLQFKDLHDARKYFFIWLLESIFKDIDSKNSQITQIKNIDFQMLYVNFINVYLERHFLAVFQLLRINKLKSQFGFFQKIAFTICEQKILQEALLNFKDQNIGSAFDISVFIEGNHQQIQLNKLYDQTTLDIIEFWRYWKLEDPRLIKIIKKGRKISKDIKLIKYFTSKLEETSFIKKDMMKYQMFALFHLEMLNDPITCQAMNNYLKNTLIFRDKNRLFNQLTGIGAPGASQTPASPLQNHAAVMTDQGLCIVQAWGGEHNHWEFLYGNKTVCQIVGCKESQLPGSSINIIMPQGIAVHHDDFVKRFYTEGHPRVLGKLRVLYIKDLEGYLVPVSFRLNFYYHYKFNYAFIASVEKVKFMNMFMEESSRISSDDCMAFMVDQDLNVVEKTRNVLKFLSLDEEKWKQIEDVKGKVINMQDIIIDLDEIMRSEFGISFFPEFDHQAMANRPVSFRKYNPNTDSLDENCASSGIMTYFQLVFPRVQKEKCLVHTFLLLPVSKHPDYDGLGTQSSLMKFRGGNKTVGQVQEMIRSLQPNSPMFRNMGVPTGGQIEYASGSDGEYNPQSHAEAADMSIQDFSSMSSTSSTDQLMMQANYAKNLLFQDTAPKSLKINAFILIGMLISFFIINGYNIGVFLENFDEIDGRQWTYHYILQRNNNQRAAIFDLKILQQIPQNLTRFNISNILPIDESRINFYLQDLKINIENVQSYSQLFEDYINTNKDTDDFNLIFEGIKFLTEEGKTYTNDLPLSHSIALFISYVDSINFEDLLKQKPNLNVTTYQDQSIKRLANFTLTQLQRNLFFAFENSIYKMEEFGQRQVKMVFDRSYLQSQHSKNTLNITTFISIGIIALILLSIFPLLTRAFEREYLVITFFNQMGLELIQQQLDKGIIYRQRLLKVLADEDENEKDKKDQSTDKSNKSREGSFRISSFNEQSKKSFQSNGKKSHNIYGQGDTVRGGVESQREIQKSDLTYSKQVKKRKLKPKLTVKINDSIFSKGKTNQKDEILELEEVKIESKDNSARKSGRDESRSDRSDANSERELSKQKKINNTEDLQILSRKKFINQQISRYSIQQKIKVFVAVLLGIGYLSAILMVSFYQSQSVFNYDSQATKVAGMMFEREACFMNMFIFLREQLIQDKRISYKIYESPDDYSMGEAVEQVIKSCLQLEMDIQRVRKNPPPYVSNATQKIEDFESPLMCNLTFSDEQEAKACFTVKDKILSQGMGSAMQLIISYVQQIDISYDSRSSQPPDFLKSILESEKMHEFMDVCMYYFRHTFIIIQDIIQETTTSYFQDCKTNYLLTSGIFIVATFFASLIFGYLAFKRLKRNILDIQNILILVPLPELEHKLRLKIESYLSK